MTGFRIGYACAPSPLVEAMMKVHQYAIMCAPTTAQDAALEALERGWKDVVAMRADYERRRNFIVAAFNACGLECFKPHGSFYVFPRVAGTGLSSHDFSVRLLRERSVAVVPGTAFGPSGEGYVRACFATGMDQLKIAAERIASFCDEVRAGG
jgi:aminotransferase